ncbi:hypothetical protein EIP91_008834 [Steccherinum ochraceum]|uniref:Major facilitator superfamily (MFS) profile domain-containing protein n=1 Tax=Steccherinum ochraceum TaxID=92696 RepID=A0A4R0RFI6_9APHY|nr:hypothetical protein EIP91_008834 [Steccherinum ochraceum]
MLFFETHRFSPATNSVVRETPSDTTLRDTVKLESGVKKNEREDVFAVAEEYPNDSRYAASLQMNTEGSIFIDWDGPTDPANPKNWSVWRKWAITMVPALYSGISPLASSVASPGNNLIAADLHITNPVVLDMTTTIFVLAYAFGPMIFSPLSEVYGRRRVLHGAHLLFLAFNLGCGFAQTTAQLLIFRFLAGLGGSCPLAVGGGVISDMWSTDDRGQAVNIFSLWPFLGPAIGPIAGSWIAQNTTWRWAFWSTTIAGAVLLLLGIIVLEETYAPLILERKAKAHKLILEKKGVLAPEVHVAGVMKQHWKLLVRKALIRPFQLFFGEAIIQVFGIYMAFIYGLLYLFLTSMPGIFKGIYGQSVGIAGLHYIALALGIVVGSLANAMLLNKVYNYCRKRNGGQSKPEFRLPLMIPGSVLLPVGLFLTGWTARHNIHWIVPDIGIVLVGAGILLDFVAIQTYVIDAFALHAASALAAVMFIRALAGFGFPLFSPYMYSALGYGKGDTILAAFAIAVGCPAPFFFWHVGARFRRKSEYAA